MNMKYKFPNELTIDDFDWEKVVAWRKQVLANPIIGSETIFIGGKLIAKKLLRYKQLPKKARKFFAKYMEK